MTFKAFLMNSQKSNGPFNKTFLNYEHFYVKQDREDMEPLRQAGSGCGSGKIMRVNLNPTMVFRAETELDYLKVIDQDTKWTFPL